jgi:hypothetical protein
MDVQMSKVHQTTYKAIFQHPAARNLQWRDVRSMLNSIADVEEEHNGHLVFTRHGEKMTLHPPKNKDLSDIEELMKIRHFLERSVVPSSSIAGEGKHLLVVIDHREARVYQTELHGEVPQRIVPYDPSGSYRHLYSVGNEVDGHQRQPELKSFYEAIVERLIGAEKILIFGSSTGASSAMEQLMLNLTKNHPDLANKVIGAVTIDEQHRTEDQLLAQAREFDRASELQNADD